MTAGRPPATAPRGRVTLAEASVASGLSTDEIRRRCVSGQIPSAAQDDTGVWSMRRGDLPRLTRRAPSTDKRRAVMTRPTVARYECWERTAGSKPVSVWLAELADAASGWTGKP